MRKLWSSLITLLGLSLAVTAQAADHRDGAAAIADPASDITDVYAWTDSSGTMLNLIMNVAPSLTEGAPTQFSDAVQYVFHVNSGDGLAALGNAQTETLIICEFAADGMASCWAGAEYATGDASDPGAPLANAENSLTVYAGMRNDPFFFNLAGFNDTVAAVQAAAGGLAFDEAGCPTLDGATAATLVGLLQGSSNPGDTFLGANVLSLAVQVDLSLVNGGGDALGVWGSTHTRPINPPANQ